MQIRSVAEATLWQVASKMVTTIAGVVSVKLVTTLLKPELVGPYFTVYEYLQIFGILADFGLYAVAVREVSRVGARERTLGALFLLRFLITLVSLGSAVLLAWLNPLWRGTVLPLGVSIAVFVPFFTLLAGMDRVVFQVEFRMGYVALAEILGRVSTIGLLILLFLFGVRDDGRTSIFILTLVCGSVGAFLLFLLLSVTARKFLRKEIVFDRREIYRIFSHALPYGLAFLATALYRQMDLTLLSILRPQDFALQTALYGTALRVVEAGIIVPSFLLNSVLPLLGERSEAHESRRLLGRTLLALLWLAVIMTLTTFFWSRPLVLLFTGEAYLSSGSGAGADTALRILSTSLGMNVVITYAFYSLLTVHHWRPLLVTTALAAALSLSLNILVIPRFGFLGAAWTSVGIHLFLLVTLVPVALGRVLPQLVRQDFHPLLIVAFLYGVLLFSTSSLLSTAWTALVGVCVAPLVLIVLLRVFGVTSAFRRAVAS